MHPLLKPRHPLIQIPIDIAAIAAWFAVALGPPTAVFILVLTR
jgi:hypothetical protein